MSSSTKINIPALGIFLCVICVVATAGMGIVYTMTQAPIAAAKEKKMVEGLERVLPKFDNDPVKDKIESDGVVFYRAKKSGRIIAVAVEASVGSGYAGNIKGLVGFGPDGKILNYMITEHNETPGLGTKVTDPDNTKTILDVLGLAKKKKGPAANRYLEQFKGHSVAAADAWTKRPWSQKSVGGEVDGVSGATITSKAVTELAWKASTALEKNKARIFSGK